MALMFVGSVLVNRWMRRWHPDTWSRYSLDDADSAAITERVLAVSKEINDLLRIYRVES